MWSDFNSDVPETADELTLHSRDYELQVVAIKDKKFCYIQTDHTDQQFMCISEAKRPDDYHKWSGWMAMLSLYFVE